MDYSNGNREECHHVLQTPEIVEHILSFCNTRDLQACRLVSRLWESASKRHWKAVATVNLKQIQVWRFLDHAQETNQETYYCNFNLSGIYGGTGPGRFWTLCGSNIKQLELNNYYSINVQWVRRILLDFTRNMTGLKLGKVIAAGNYSIAVDLNEPQFGENWNLKSLSFHRNYIHHPGISFRDILLHFPGLQVEDGKFDRLFQSLRILRRTNPNKLKLQHISTLRPKFPTATEIVPALLEVLTDPTLQLKSISIGINGENADESLSRIFRANGNSLKTLEVERRAPRCAFLDPVKIFNQPEITFKNLTVIVLRTRMFLNLSFLKFTSNLTKLSIFIYGNEHDGIIRKTKIGDMKNVRLEKCKEFSYNKFVSVYHILRLVRWLPNVERLSLPLSNRTFTCVCRHWCNLTWLTIPESCVDESAFTGLDAEHVRIYNDGHGLFPLDNPTVPKANITCFKDLQKLVMIGSNHNLSFNYAAVKIGISQLPILQQLSIRGYQENTLSASRNIVETFAR